eukprot:754656-Hanusia_phi.AAC.1
MKEGLQVGLEGIGGEEGREGRGEKGRGGEGRGGLRDEVLFKTSLACESSFRVNRLRAAVDSVNFELAPGKYS